MTVHLSDLIAATGGHLHGPVGAEAWGDFCHDSRLAQAGQLFVALRTPTGDGHDHIAAAVAQGCSGVLCQHLGQNHPAVTTLLVPDTGDALRAWAAQALRKIDPLVIAITGSSGKTTTKELTAELLERQYPGRVFRTRESYNDRLGIPLALGRLQAEHEIAVLELGTDAHGEIAELAALVSPTIGAITVIQDAHIGVFGDLDAIAAEKLALFQALKNGIAVVNADDPYQVTFLRRQSGPVLAHSAERDAAVHLTAGSVSEPGVFQTFTLGLDPERILSLRSQLYQLRPSIFPTSISQRPPALLSLRSPLLGAHQQASLRTAISIALLLGVTADDIVDVVNGFRPLPGRLRLLDGLHGSVLLDDSYSATPAATRAALQTLAEMPADRRIVVLGEHSGLGAEAAAHLSVLAPDMRRVADELIVVGPQARAVADAAQNAGLAASAIHLADTAAATADLVRPLLGPGVAVLIKGSREARLERVTASLLAEPTAAPALLVRQNPVWQGLRLRNSLRPTWVEIDTLALADNVRATLARLQPGAQLIAVLKADAYGHGAPTVARIVTQAGADMIAVACLPEAQVLRRAGIDAPILILGYSPPWQARPALELDLHLTIYERDVAEAVNQAAQALGCQASVHVKVDTGMGRLGLLPADVPDFIRFVRTLRHVRLVGLFSHMANADEPEDPYTDEQLERFRALLAELERLDLRPPLVHVANTATLLTRPEAHYDAVRLGIGLYGLPPGPHAPLPEDYRPALSWKTTIAQVKTFPPGTPIGYGLTYRTTGRQSIAVIPVGYADGFRRAPRNWGYVLVRGRRAPLVGRVSMDQAAIDVTSIPGVRSGDEVVLIGRQGDETLTADDVAARLGTINYEVISAILARVPRVPE